MGNDTFLHTFLREEEEITYVIHKHWWSVVKPIGKALVLGIALPLFAYWLFIEASWIYITIPWIVIGIVYVVRAFLDWYYDVLLITNECVIDIDWRGFFNKSANRIDFDTIEGVEYISHGILSTIFKFGSVQVQLRSGDILDLSYTANAREMQRLILDKRDEFATESETIDQDVETLKRAIKSLLGDEMVKRKHGIAVEEVPEEDENEPEDIEAEYDDVGTDEYGEDDDDLPEPEHERPVIVMETREIPSTDFSEKKPISKTPKKKNTEKKADSPKRKPRKKNIPPNS